MMHESPRGCLLSRREAAEMLAVSIDTIARLIEQGELGTVKIGRTLRVPRDDVQALVDRRRRVAASGRETGQ